jgi:hypothetical protein
MVVRIELLIQQIQAKIKLYTLISQRKGHLT